MAAALIINCVRPKEGNGGGGRVLIFLAFLIPIITKCWPIKELYNGGS